MTTWVRLATIASILALVFLFLATAEPLLVAWLSRAVDAKKDDDAARAAVRAPSAAAAAALTKPLVGVFALTVLSVVAWPIALAVSLSTLGAAIRAEEFLVIDVSRNNAAFSYLVRPGSCWWLLFFAVFVLAYAIRASVDATTAANDATGGAPLTQLQPLPTPPPPPQPPRAAIAFAPPPFAPAPQPQFAVSGAAGGGAGAGLSGGGGGPAEGVLAWPPPSGDAQKPAGRPPSNVSGDPHKPAGRPPGLPPPSVNGDIPKPAGRPPGSAPPAHAAKPPPPAPAPPPPAPPADLPLPGEPAADATLVNVRE